MSSFANQNWTFFLFITIIIPIFVPSKNQIMTEQEIYNICKKYNIINYSINPDGSIDVDGNVDLMRCDFEKIPLKFNKVNGDFICSSCFNLTTLEGSPKYVNGDFYCSLTWIESLEHSPLYIGGKLYAYSTNLKSLNGYNGECDKLKCDKEQLLKKFKRSIKLKSLEKL